MGRSASPTFVATTRTRNREPKTPRRDSSRRRTALRTMTKRRIRIRRTTK
jgi:hypothetical protein